MYEKHSPEPWIAKWNKNVWPETCTIMPEERGMSICKIVTSKHDEANAERIVSCVNAMAKIENPQEYMLRVKLLEKEHHQLKERAGKLRVQNDELWEALISLHRLVMQSKDRAFFDNGQNAEVVAKAWETIQKATQ